MSPVVLTMVAVGGAVGAVLRFLLSRVAGDVAGAYPLATQIANVGGSFLIGLTYVLIAERWGSDHPAWAFVAIGLLGGFTTFSSFSLETLRLAEQGRLALAAGYVTSSVLLCLLAAFAGMSLGRR